VGARRSQPTRKIEELESIRGLAAALVVRFHVPSWNSTLWNLNLIRNGDLMVQLFFVLSGFVIYRAYAHRIERRSDLFRFELLRFGRLYPTHLVFLLVFLAIETAKLFTRGGSRSMPFVRHSASAFVDQLLLVQAIGPTGNTFADTGPGVFLTTLNANGWTPDCVLVIDD
jgi:peptidoglycan/LPS O-acetylase OafA/YrhL